MSASKRMTSRPASMLMGLLSTRSRVTAGVLNMDLPLTAKCRRFPCRLSVLPHLVSAHGAAQQLKVAATNIRGVLYNGSSLHDVGLVSAL